MKPQRFTLLLAIALLTVVGCSGTGEVSGLVKFRGQPLPGGTISFYDEGGRVSSAEIKPDGSYNVTGVPTGLAKVTVSTPVFISYPGAKTPPKTPALPKEYADRDKSGHTCRVQGGPQIYNLDLD